MPGSFGALVSGGSLIDSYQGSCFHVQQYRLPQRQQHSRGPDLRSGSVNSETPYMAVTKSLVTTSTRYSGITPRHRIFPTVAVLGAAIAADRLSWAITAIENCRNPPLRARVRTTTVPSNTKSAQPRVAATTRSHIMPCSAGELFRLPHMARKAPEGHVCRRLCGGHLHGICGEVEDPDGGNEMHRKASATRASPRKQKLPAAALLIVRSTFLFYFSFLSLIVRFSLFQCI